MMATRWKRNYGFCPNRHKVVTDTAAKDGKNGADVLIYGEDGAEPTLVLLEPEDLPGMVAQEIVRAKEIVQIARKRSNQEASKFDMSNKLISYKGASSFA